jgi:hypothetical protein
LPIDHTPGVVAVKLDSIVYISFSTSSTCVPPSVDWRLSAYATSPLCANMLTSPAAASAAMVSIVAAESTMPMSPVTATVHGRPPAGHGAAGGAGSERKARSALSPKRVSPTTYRYGVSERSVFICTTCSTGERTPNSTYCEDDPHAARSSGSEMPHRTQGR